MVITVVEGHLPHSWDAPDSEGEANPRPSYDHHEASRLEQPGVKLFFYSDLDFFAHRTRAFCVLVVGRHDIA